MWRVVSLLFRTHSQNMLPTNRWPSSPLPALSRGASGMPNVELSIWSCRYSRSHVDTAYLVWYSTPLFSHCGMAYSQPPPRWRTQSHQPHADVHPNHLHTSTVTNKQLDVVNGSTTAGSNHCLLCALNTSRSDIYTPIGRAER